MQFKLSNLQPNSGSKNLLMDLRGSLPALVFTLCAITTAQLASAATSPRDRDVLLAVAEANPSFDPSGNWTGDPCLDSWRGIICDDSTASSSASSLPTHRIVTINLYTSNLTGPLPPQIAALSSLRILNLWGNNLSGPLPPQLGSMPYLTELHLYRNAFTGPIPIEFSSMPSIVILRLARNSLVGTIPVVLANLSSTIERLHLDGNAFTGPVPPELGSLLLLTHLDLARNNLTGGIPLELGRLSALQRLSLEENGLTGPVPASFANLSPMGIWLNLSSNYLNGTVPPFARPFVLSTNCFKANDSDSNEAGQRDVGTCVAYYRQLESQKLPLLPAGAGSPPPVPPPQAPPGPGPKAKQAPTLVVGASVGGGLVIFAVALVLVLCFCRRKPAKNGGPASITIEDSRVKQWKLSELLAATENFNDAFVLGKGGYATVYKAVLEGGTVAVKRISAHAVELQGGHDQFLKEVQTIGAIHYRNLLVLQGYCIEGGEYLLIYDYMPNGSLEDCLFKHGSNLALNWAQCVSILMGTANAIAYLHEGCKRKIIHRDIKPANILLDKDFSPNVADFGLAKTAMIDDTHVIVTNVAGTHGYLAPEYAGQGKLTEKSDVFSFGVVILVVISHRTAIDTSGKDEIVFIVERAWKATQDNRLLDIVAPHLCRAYDEDQAKRFISIAILCTQPDWQARPSMGDVVQMMKGNIDVPPVALNSIIALHSPNPHAPYWSFQGSTSTATTTVSTSTF